MTKKEIVSELVNKYGVKDNGLMKKKLPELEEMLENAKNKAEVNEEIEKAEVKEIISESSNEEVAEKNSEALESTLEDNKEEVASEVQLNIHETVVRRFNSSQYVKIENLGAGDVYIGDSKEDLIHEDNKLKPNDSVKMGNVSILYITSASRPIIRITYASHCL